MKNWITIGQFAKSIGVSAKALRLYEEIGLLKSHIRGDNGYRYYDVAQLEIAHRLKDFKDLGFSLAEIKALLEADRSLNSEKMCLAMSTRLQAITQQSEVLKSQKEQIETILSSLKKKTEPLKVHQRRAIMSYYGKASILVVGSDDLDLTAVFISKQFKNSNIDIPTLKWSESFQAPLIKPYIVTLPESDLDKSVENINADIIVIRNLSTCSEELNKKYLKLFKSIGPHVCTILMADDLAAVELVKNKQVQKGRIYYVSKNKNLEPQLKNIGGVYSYGSEIKIFGLNQAPVTELNTKRILAHKEELALLFSLATVMDIGLKTENLYLA